MKVKGDNPIRDVQEDSLGRFNVAKLFAQQILSLDISEGAVVGVLGEWGSGKTSFINLARPELEQACAVILDFNPWMFSGAEQLVERFFAEMSAQLEIKNYTAAAKSIAEYGEVFSSFSWVPVLGSWVGPVKGITKLVSQVLEARQEGVSRRREKLEKILEKVEQPIIVILDDIDRLSSSEIRDVFKLVRLTASFPNVIYLVAFDRSRVEQALSEQGVPGRTYLEKILQIAVDLPSVPSAVMIHQISTAIDNAIAEIENPGPFDDQVWPDIFMEMIHPLIRNMRDVRRYAASVHGTVKALEGQIALTDVLALEAIRTFLPDVHTELAKSVESLTTTSSLTSGAGTEPPELKEQINSLIKVADNHQDLVKDIIRRLFPAGERHIGGSHYGPDWISRWIRERRVAHKAILELYFERVAGEGLLAFTDAERAFSLMNNQSAFDKYLRSLDIEHLEDVIASLEAFEDKFAPEYVEPCLTVLLNILPILPEKPRGLFSFDSGTVVRRITFRLLRSLNDPTKVEGVVKSVLPKIKSLSTKIDLIVQVGHLEGGGHKFVSEEVAKELESNWRNEVRKATPKALAKEKDLFRLLFAVKKHSTENEPTLKLPDTPILTHAIIKNALGYTRSQTAGSRAIRQSPRLQWDNLIEFFGGQEELEARINKLRLSKIKKDNELISLVDKYLSGWRPSHFDDD